MKGLCATTLMLTMGWQSISAAGPLERSASREAIRLARESAGQADRSDWRTVRLLDPGTKIVITTADEIMTGAFVSVDDTALFVSRDAAIVHLNVDDVQMIERRVRRGSAVAAVFGTLGGFWLGSAMAYGLAESSRCYRSCGPEIFAVWTAIIGVPILGGYGAWRGSSRLTEEVIYRRLPAVRP
jgi:hypothetical protein